MLVSTELTGIDDSGIPIIAVNAGTGGKLGGGHPKCQRQPNQAAYPASHDIQSEMGALSFTLGQMTRSLTLASDSCPMSQDGAARWQTRID